MRCKKKEGNKTFTEIIVKIKGGELKNGRYRYKDNESFQRIA